MKKQPEFILQKQVCQYLRLQYPSTFFLSDTVASVKLTLPQQARNKAIQCNGFKTPDLIIFEPKKNYSGLFIELKKETPFKKSGEVKASQNNHLDLQNNTLMNLRSLGYKASFAWTFDMAKNIIDDYMRLPDTELLF